MPNTDETQSAILKALADENRIRLIRLLSREVLNVQELCDIMDIPQPRVSRHLSVLRSMNLVNDQREGSRVYYQINELEGDLEMIADYLKGIAEQAHPDLKRLDEILQRRTTESRHFAGQRAEKWDEIGSQLHSSTAALFALAELSRSDQIFADLGTGTGLLLPILSSAAGKVYAVDHAPEMLDLARERCSKEQLENIDFIQSEIENLEEKLPESCDAVLIHFVMHQLARPQQVCEIVSHLLKPVKPMVLSGLVLTINKLNNGSAMQN